MAKLAFNMYVADDSLPSGYVLLPEGSECPPQFEAMLGEHCFEPRRPPKMDSDITPAEIPGPPVAPRRRRPGRDGE